VTSRKWQEMEAQIDELLAQKKYRNSARPILRGAALSGNAWEDYLKAIRRVESSGIALGPASNWLKERDKASHEALQRLKDACGPALEDLRRGVQRAEGQYVRDWDHVLRWIEGGPPVEPIRALIALGILDVQDRVKLGRSKEAAEILLDLCQFARDAGNNGTLLTLMIGIYHYEYVLAELRDLLLSRGSEPEVAELVARELTILDASFPDPALTFENELLATGLFFKKLPQEPKALELDIRDHAIAHWRYGFLWRLRVTSAWSDMKGWYARASEASRGAWLGVDRIEEEILEAYAGTNNDVVRVLARPNLKRLTQVRGSKAHLRLLRVASHFLATGDTFEVEDPFGGKLHTSKAGDKLTIWSNGPDGLDHGGSGGWDLQSGQDIVLGVQR